MKRSVTPREVRGLWETAKVPRCARDDSEAGSATRLAYLALLEEALGIVDLDQPALADFHEAVGDGAGEVAVVADEQARHVALLQLGLECFLALDVEMVGRLVQQVHVGPEQLHLEEHQARAFAVAQDADRLRRLWERGNPPRQIPDRVP